MSTMTEPDTTTPAPLVFRASRLADAAHKINLANRRLARHGVTERFTYTATEFLTDERNSLGEPTGNKLRMIEFRLSAPRLCLNGWEFIATLIHEQAGVIARTVPGRSLDGWTPNTERVCDHCNTNRRRKDTYVVRNSSGEVRQVGSNCLPAFLGIAPVGLWALAYDLDLADTEDSDFNGGGGGADSLVSAARTIAYALAASDLGRAYKSKASCQFGGGRPTVGVVQSMMWPTRQEARDLADLIAAGDSMDPALVAEVLDAARTIEGDSEYASNLRTIAASDHLDVRNMGLLVSAVGAWNRARQVQVERESRPAVVAGFLAPVGAKIADVPAVVTGVNVIEGQWGDTTILTMSAEATGHTLKWFASRGQGVSIGDRVVIVSATVKKHEQYQGADQTVITRAKLAAV